MLCKNLICPICREELRRVWKPEHLMPMFKEYVCGCSRLQRRRWKESRLAS